MPQPDSAIISAPGAEPERRLVPDKDQPRPAVVALIGVQGAGKACVARALVEQLGMRRVCRDAIREAMFPQFSFSFAEKRAAFRTLLLTLEINCLLGESSVIDGTTFARRRDLSRVGEVVSRYGFMPIPVFLDCSTEVADARIAERLRAEPQRAQAPIVRGRFDTPPPNALKINANLALDEVSRIVVAAVAQLRAP